MANIRNNTTTIQSILETVKSLPEAGSGGVTPPEVPEVEELNPIIPSGKDQTFPPVGETKLYSKVVIKAVDDNVIKSIYGDNVVNTAVTDGTNAAAEHILSGKKAYVNGSPVTGEIPIKSSDNLTVNGGTITGAAGYYSNGISKSVNTGTLGKPSIDSNGKVSSTVATAGYLATNASTPDNNVLQLTTMEGNINNPITPSTTSKKVVSAGTYTTGDIYVGAIPNQKTGGTYTLNPGESISRAAGTYLTSALNVTAAAAAASGGGYVGALVSTTRTNSKTLSFSVNTDNLIGFHIIVKSPIYMAADYDQQCIAYSYFNGNAYITYYAWESDEDASVAHTAVNNNNITHTIDTGTITLSCARTGMFGFDITYYLFPIYSS